MITNKRIYLTLLFGIGCSQPTLAMDASKEELNKSLLSMIATANKKICKYNLGAFWGDVQREKKALSFEKELKYWIVQIKSCIAQGADVNTQTQNGVTALMVAAVKGDKETCAQLINLKADVNAQSPGGHTALYEAVIFNHPAVCALLIENQAQADVHDKSKNTPLKKAIEKGAEQIYTMLINAHADVNAGCPLSTAALRKNIHACQLLLDHKADINHGNPLVSAVESRDEKICNFLLDAGANINAGTPLVTAAHKRNQKICALLIARKADVNAQNDDGRTALHVAIRHTRADDTDDVAIRYDKPEDDPNNEMNKLPICQILLDAKAEVDALTHAGCTPLAYAAHEGNKKICELLIAHNASVNSKNADGATPLTHAAAKGKTKVCELLLAHNADPAAFNVVNSNNQTPLMVAALGGNLRLQDDNIRLCTFFINSGANVNAQNNVGHTALFLAVDQKNIKTIQSLLDAGAKIDLKTTKGTTPLMYVSMKMPNMPLGLSLGRMLITNAQFNPLISQKEQGKCASRILTALCVFKRLYPALPKDVRTLILMIDPELRQDFCSIAAPIHKNKHLRTPYMPIPTICKLLKNGLLDFQATVSALKEHNIKCLIPLMEEAREKAIRGEMQEFLNPNNLGSNFGDEIKQNIERRLLMPAAK